MKPTTPDPTAQGTEMGPEYDALIVRARAALDATPDLPPSRWVELRAGVDEGIARDQSGGMGWAWVAVAVASAAALLLSVSPAAVQPPPVESFEAALSVQSPAPAPPAAPAAPSIVPGQILTAGATPRTFDAFGRHSLTLDPGATMEIVAWSPRDLAVRLRAGRVTADIAKASPGERIQIATDTALVRVVGTRFSVSHEPSGATRVDVVEGVVEVRARDDAASAPARVTAGQTHRVEVAQAPPAAPAPPRPKVNKRPRPRKSGKRGPSTDRVEEGGFRVIEINVPPQQSPNAR